MSLEELLQSFPSKRIKPSNGMAVTAEVWEEAHEYHRQQQRFHTMLGHGPGILTGLEVIASDPPDTSVYILPGIAVDPAGQTIVLPQPVAYDIGQEMEGLLYLLLSYGESRPRLDSRKGEEDGPLYVHTEFSISARTSLPSGPWIELARVRRRSRESPFFDAPNPVQPDLDEIDLRFRREIGMAREVNIAISYLGNTDKKHGRGFAYLARALNRQGRYRVYVHDDVPVAPGIETNTLIYLVGQGNFELNSGQMNGLYNFVNRGWGTLLVESGDSAAESIFLNFLRTVDMTPKPIQAGHYLLMDPYLFAAPPPGFEAQGMGEILVRDGVIFSTSNYGRLWQGEIREGTASRELIRSGFEWGTNIVSYAVERRRRVAGQ